MRDPDYLGYESLAEEISTFITTYPPPFIYINDLTSPRITSDLLSSLLTTLSTSDPGPSSPRIHFGKVNGIACFTARLLYDSILNSLTDWTPKWSDGCANWGADGEVSERWNDSFDNFLHGLKAARDYLKGRAAEGINLKRKGKAKAKASENAGDVRLVILIERAERLKDNLSDLLVPLTRLTELSQIDLTIIFHSEVRWEDIKPPLGAALDPYFIDVPPLPKETIVRRLASNFPPPGRSNTSSSPGPFHPSLKSLYHHFISILTDICFPFIHDPIEIQYIAAARWLGFVQPVLDQQQQHNLSENSMDVDNLYPPSEDVRLRLSRLFAASLNKAMEELYPRLTNAVDWAALNQPEPNLLSQRPSHVVPSMTGEAKTRQAQVIDGGLRSTLPRLSQFILVAAFLASTNPAKSDIRMFGRGLDEKRRKRRARKVPAGKRKSGPAKIPTRLSGPLPFPLDRLIAILGVLLEENDVDERLPKPQHVIPGDYTDMEISRVGIYAAIMELTSMRLLHRTSHPDRIDGPPMFKCGISYDTALSLARHLKVPLNDLMWDPT